MRYLLLFILLSWSNSQVTSAALCHGITSHAGQKGRRLCNMGQCMVECFTMTSCMLMNIQTTCGDQMNYDVAM
jgi:hypothetical protein